MDVFIKAVLGGISIAIGGTVFLSCDNKLLGAFLFSIGLFAILTRGYRLFTGAIGHFWEKGPKYKFECMVIWLGNLVGTVLGATAIRFTRLETIRDTASQVVDTKLNDGSVSILILSIFCGMLMYIAVHGWNTARSSTVQMMACVLPVAVFIIAGFEHCVANMYYFGLTGLFSTSKAWIYLALMTAGNAIGSWILSVPMYLLDRKEQKEHTHRHMSQRI